MKKSLKLLVYLGIGLGATFIIAALLVPVFSDKILNDYVKQRLERKYAEAHPGSDLRIGGLEYAVGDNCIVAHAVALNSPNSTITVGRISLTGIRWMSLLSEKVAPADLFATASLNVVDFDAEFHRSGYGISCARLRASALNSELIAEEAELRPMVGDARYFAHEDFRKSRFYLVVPECTASGLAFDDLIRGVGFHAQSVLISRPSLDVLVSRHLPVNPMRKPPKMVPEALSAILQPFQIDSLIVTDGHVVYSERVVASADPGVLTITGVNVNAQGISNHGGKADAILIRAQGKLMNDGMMKVNMTIPLTTPELSLHYSGSIGAMDLTSLNEFLVIAEQTRIMTGMLEEASFEIDVAGGQAAGSVHGVYKDLKVAFNDKKTGSEKGLGKRITSYLANTLKLRKANGPEASGPIKSGNVHYTRKTSDQFIKFVWFSLRTGVLDIINQ